MRTRFGFLVYDADFALFDGEGGAAAPAANSAANAPANTQAGTPANTNASPQPAAPEAQVQTPSPEERRKSFRNLIQGEYKDLFAEATQRVANQRTREAQQLQNRLNAIQPLLDTLSRRYGVGVDDPARLASAVDSDTALWAGEAERAGMTVEQYTRMRQLEQANARLAAQQRDAQARYLADRKYAQWMQEAEGLKAKYPDFDFQAMQSNELFGLMLKNGYPMEQAYRAAAVDEIEARAAKAQEKAVTDNIRAKGQRPKEASGGAAPFQVKLDPGKMSREEILDTLSRLDKGEKISFG